MKSPLISGLSAAAGLALGLTALMAPAAAQAQRMDAARVNAMISGWPESAKMAAMDQMRKYGPPTEATPTMLMWRGNGPWKWTRIDNKESQHMFPGPHPDVMEQAIDYRVPVGKFDELAKYDGSVNADRTQGLLSARCDKEGANFLAVNLAHDIVTNRRNVNQARDYYAKAIMTFKTTGQMDPYMQRLQFQPNPGDQGDPDQPAK